MVAQTSKFLKLVSFLRNVQSSVRYWFVKNEGSKLSLYWKLTEELQNKRSNLYNAHIYKA